MGPHSRNTIFPVALIVSALFFFVTYDGTSEVKSWLGSGPKPRFIFVDLGANRADSLQVFMQHPEAKFKYDYPRPEWASYKNAEIYLFEANPVFNTALVQAKEHYDALGVKVNIFPSTVVDITDGTRTFFLDTVNTATDFWGSSIYATHPDVVLSQSKGTELAAVNLARWLLMNTLPRDFVVVKMDIEGAEYELVPHLAEMSTWSVIDYLLVEWHGAEIGGGTPEEIKYREMKADAAGKRMVQEGVQMPPYNSAA
ncbi:hypothetical protein BGZ98_006461 [Dissophora globulifera]|nr:hypothetical protein BGZ98_006461 [Dissophora globulifera]